MTREELFETWAPPRSPWSAWAKPVVFAEMPLTAIPGQALPALPDASWAPDPSETAVIVNLDGADSVMMGLALGRRGYRPVPLFNGNDGPSPLIDMGPLRMALASAAPTLSGLGLADAASPAFLIDGRRQAPRPSPGKFDNRWLVFPQDVPSANLLLSKGIRRVIVCQLGQSLAEDLCHVLLRWQQAGIAIQVRDVQTAAGPTDVVVKQPKRFRSILYRLLAVAGLRRNSAGGFGSVVPQASSGGGHRGGFH
jgi:hypothetical protein